MEKEVWILDEDSNLVTLTYLYQIDYLQPANKLLEPAKKVKK